MIISFYLQSIISLVSGLQIALAFGFGRLLFIFALRFVRAGRCALLSLCILFENRPGRGPFSKPLKSALATDVFLLLCHYITTSKNVCQQFFIVYR